MTRHNGTGRNVAMLLGGLAAGIVGSRVLPPLLAGAAGSGRARSGADPFAKLIDDHRQILSVLDRMAAAPSDSKMLCSRLFLMLKRKLAKHAMAEEDVVYPRVPNAPESGGRKHLYDEHADMKVLLFEMEDALMNGRDWSAAVASLTDLVRRHANEEEQTIFPELRRQLSGGAAPKLSGQISREEALVL